jgi:hypothetical protein
MEQMAAVAEEVLLAVQLLEAQELGTHLFCLHHREITVA